MGIDWSRAIGGLALGLGQGIMQQANLAKEEALKALEFAHQEALVKMQQEFTASESEKQRAHELKLVGLKTKGGGGDLVASMQKLMLQANIDKEKIALEGEEARKTEAVKQSGALEVAKAQTADDYAKARAEALKAIMGDPPVGGETPEQLSARLNAARIELDKIMPPGGVKKEPGGPPVRRTPAPAAPPGNVAPRFGLLPGQVIPGNVAPLSPAATKSTMDGDDPLGIRKFITT